MKTNKMVLANAFALAVGVAYVVCRFLVSLFPQLSAEISKAWFHIADLSTVSGIGFDLNLFVLGLVSSVVTAWFFGYLLGWSIEFFGKQK